MAFNVYKQPHRSTSLSASHISSLPQNKPCRLLRQKSLNINCNVQQQQTIKSSTTTSDSKVASTDLKQKGVSQQVPKDQVSAKEKDSKKFTDYREGILLQGFGWQSCQKGEWYKTIQSKVEDLAACQVSHVWLPPPSQSVSPEGYLPGRLYDLNSKYGSKDDLVSLTTALKSAGITPIADIVINHRCANIQDEEGRWNKYEDVDPNGKKIEWSRYAITCNDPVFGGKGAPDTGEDFWGAPDLDHTNEELRRDLKDWLQYLKNGIGFMGWRFDFVKGFAAKYVEEYILESVGPEAFNVGELWPTLGYGDSGDLDYDQNPHRQILCDWVNSTNDLCTVFDFTLKGILQESVKNTQYGRLKDKDGKPTGMLGWWGEKAVTFIDNHDTGSSQQHWPFPAEYVETGYAYILTHPGMPCIFWEHLYDWGQDLQSKLKKLMAIRKKCGVRANSKIKIMIAEDDMYVAKIRDNLVVKLGPRFDMGQHLPNEKEGWTMDLSGKDFAIWTKK
eukprot:TRINITY_DN38157_c0_g1_i2.p1 TRINITY_DN38157_c0_g1~~TRINITY_DN38157_c0_g1_i2.p1  ORF type:complete len:546 (-),score=76.16 TRINITY_DN38157_c0_g1_i2:460-1965(-)